MLMIYLCSVFSIRSPGGGGVRAKLQFLSNFPGFFGVGEFLYSLRGNWDAADQGLDFWTEAPS